MESTDEEIKAAMAHGDAMMDDVLVYLRGGQDPRRTSLLAMAFEKQRMESATQVGEIRDAITADGASEELIDALVAEALAFGQLSALSMLFDKVAGAMTEGARA